LYGKGGSGKTTIAYEVAKVLKTDGTSIRINGDDVLDNVLFVTAKQQTLNVLTQTPGPFVGLDFSNERELYEAILTLASWTSEPLKELALDKLKSEIKGLFDLTWPHWHSSERKHRLPRENGCQALEKSQRFVTQGGLLYLDASGADQILQHFIEQNQVWASLQQT
jgi:hypothetical protein